MLVSQPTQPGNYGSGKTERGTTLSTSELLGHPAVLSA